MTPDLHLWLIPVLPLLGAAINGIVGKKFSRQTVAGVALLFSGAAFAMVLSVAFRFSSLATPHIETLATWIRAGSFQADFAFYLDQLSLVMLLVVTGVGFLIHIYSVGYMWEEGGFYRFFSYLSLSMFFMLTLVLASNYLMMFIGWECVGLASYLLIGFFFLRDSAAAAGKKAFIVNRIGDFGFLIALFLLIKHFGSLNFEQLFKSISVLPAETTEAGLLTSIGLLLMVGAAGKSAQIPLYVWLPDAMEGPTPVSALIHAATMFTACGVAAFSAAIFHLMTHAFFKGLLFLAAGSVIHAVGGEQDMRRMGGLRTKIPWTFWTMSAGTFAIAGFWPLAGFFSKDAILFQAFISPYGSWIYWAIGLFTAFLTSFYMFRQWFMTFFGEYRGAAEGSHGHEDSRTGASAPHGHGHGGVHESPAVMVVPLAILAILSVVGGWMGSERFDKLLAPLFHQAAKVSPAAS